MGGGAASTTGALLAVCGLPPSRHAECRTPLDRATYAQAIACRSDAAQALMMRGLCSPRTLRLPRFVQIAARPRRLRLLVEVTSCPQGYPQILWTTLPRVRRRIGRSGENVCKHDQGWCRSDWLRLDRSSVACRSCRGCAGWQPSGRLQGRGPMLPQDWRHRDGQDGTHRRAGVVSWPAPWNGGSVAGAARQH